MHKLVIEDDEGKQTVVPLVRENITVGRKDGNTIRLTEKNVSREHARLTRQNGNLFIENVSARYGTKKNGDYIGGRTEFGEGDVFLIGDYRLYLQPKASTKLAQPTPATTPAPAPAQPAALPPAAAPATAPVADKTAVVQVSQATPSGSTVEPARLVVTNTAFAGSEFSVLRDEMVIGRTDDNDIVIDHRSISRHHAKVAREGSIFRIVDMGSANGVRVNGDPYATVELRRGDTVELGHVKMRFVGPGELFSFTPTAADFADDVAKGGMGKFIAMFAIILVAAGAGVFVMMGGEDNGTEPGDGTGEEVVVPGTLDDESSATGVPASESWPVIQQAEALIAEARWGDAIEHLTQIEAGDPNYEYREELMIRARNERRVQSDYEQIIQSEEAGEYQAGLALIGEIPSGSYYANYIREAGVEQRMLDAWLEDTLAVAEEYLEAERYSEARDALEPLEATFTENARIDALDDRIDDAEETAEQAQLEADRVEAARLEAARVEAARLEAERLEAERLEAERLAALEAANNAGDDEEEDDEEEDDEEEDDEEEDDEEEDGMSEEEREEAIEDLMRNAGRMGVRGDYDGAVEALEDALDLGARDADIYLMLYQNHAQLGNDDDAADALEEYLERRPNARNADDLRELLQELRN